MSGVDNVFANFLSRIRPQQKGTSYLESGEETPPIELAASEEIQFQILSLEALGDIQQSCPDMKLIKCGDKPKSTSFDYHNIDGKQIFCELSSSKPRPYVPHPLRQQIIMSLHNLDHVGIKSSQTRIASENYWPSLKEDIKNT